MISNKYQALSTKSFEGSQCIVPQPICWGGKVFPVKAGPWCNIKMLFYQHKRSQCGDKMVGRSSYLIFTKGFPTQKQTTPVYVSFGRNHIKLTDPIKWPNYPLELIWIYVHIKTHDKECLTQRCRRSTNVQLCLVFMHISIWFES